MLCRAALTAVRLFFRGLFMTDDMRGSDTYLELLIMPLREVVMFPR